MLKLPKTTEYIRVRRYRLVATNDLAAKFERNIEAENKIYNYVFKYLEKTYGVKNLKRPYPTNKNAKLFLAKDVLIPKILKDLYGLSKWDGKKVGIHSQALRDEYLVSILTNFGEYRKNLNNIKYQEVGRLKKAGAYAKKARDSWKILRKEQRDVF
ncbi:hypothetical protein [Ligilactobacillus ruminis]|uniref:hypothetical protein n=1 Tax=Ligilactobacillus ruminis TaxID=1623 RepID=UPI0022E043A9|nr:hypothetical protein [Ligilactobacillus ruminis]